MPKQIRVVPHSNGTFKRYKPLAAGEVDSIFITKDEARAISDLLSNEYLSKDHLGKEVLEKIFRFAKENE